jgi:hypothetical protein
VVVESRREKSDGTKEIFGTVGVSANIIDASWQALVDAYEYHLLHEQESTDVPVATIPSQTDGVAVSS